MKIYLSITKPQDSRKWANSLPMLDGLVLNSEATDITCDNFISSFEISELKFLLENIIIKIRINGTITIADVDADIISRRMYTNELSIEKYNNILFADQKRKSVISLSEIESMLPNSLKIESKYYDQNTCRFTLKCRRIK